MDSKDYLYSNCKISGAILQPDNQSVRFNGFAWSSTGMIHEVSKNSNQSWQSWLGTQP